MQRRKNLAFWRIEKRLKQKDICGKLGITTAHYSNLERGISDPSYELLLRFREVFGVTDVMELFDKEEIQNGYSNTSGDIRKE